MDSVRHSGGGFPIDLPSGTEVLARYDYLIDNRIHNKPSIWAYKESIQSGRVVQCGSHPEEVSSGERMELTAAMIHYALDGRGIVTLKGFLKNGEPRFMEKQTSDCLPAFTRIGDLQTHHFAVYIPSGARDISVLVSSPFDCDLALMMNQDTFDCNMAEYRSNEPGAIQKLHFASIKEGIWYISVRCLTTVVVEETEYGQNYTGKIEVLNGVPYTISINWN